MIHIGNRYALDWVLLRIRSMEAMGGLTKMGSWTLSEETLADILVLNRMEAFGEQQATPSRPNHRVQGRENGRSESAANR